MRLHFISFFYFNIILFFLFILKIDFFFIFFLFFRKSFTIFKESLTEFIFQEFDGLRKDNQTLDLYENKLYVDFGLDVGLEESYIQNLYMYYALYDISMDFEAYSGFSTLKWNDFNIEELNLQKNYNTNLKKIYINIQLTNLNCWKNLKKIDINNKITDDDFLNIYNYKNINRREYEQPSLKDENEKYYYNFLKIFFLKENFYDLYIENNYMKNLNYLNFINELKKKNFKNKYNKKKILISNTQELQILELDFNISKIREKFFKNNFFKKN